LKIFISKIIIFVIPICGIIFLLGLTIDGDFDPYYIRFTTTKKHNLILGTSRSAQGLQPKVLLQETGINFFNYSFTIFSSPFGNSYLNSIKNKLDSKRNNGYHIVTVDPWSISSLTVDPNDVENFREMDSVIEKLKFVNLKPNWFYLLMLNRKNLVNNLFNKSGHYLHNDGWLEIKDLPMDSLSKNERLESKLKNYRGKLVGYKFSEARLNALIDIIKYLKKFGDIYLVRLPIHPEMQRIEELLMKNFEERISKIIPMTKGYLDLTKNNGDYIYTDGNHLHKSSGILVSKRVGEWINTLNN
tara:strand:+ start:232 stop:1134 length:903 start_codon:yes stop_codon:yes gene_type:complete